MSAFKSALETNGLVDLGWRGQKLTWSNRHSDETLTMERLDRVVANKNWLSVFGNQGVDNVVTCRSDHHTIFYNSKASKVRAKKHKMFILNPNGC